MLQSIIFGRNSRYAHVTGLLRAMLCIILLATGAAQPVAASTAMPDATVLVKDLNPATAPSNPDNLIMVGNLLFFTASDPNHGRELWRSDGTSAGTLLLKDINPGPDDSGVANLTIFKNALYFMAYNHQGPQLWRSDGTSVGTTLVFNFANPPYESITLGLTAVNNALFVLTESQGSINNHGFIVDAPLWRSDGTPAGTSRIYDFMSVPNFSIATNITGIGNTLFLRVITSTNQILYRSDGTTRGTIALKQFGGQSNGLYAQVDQFTAVNTTLFFRANINELWKSNGTPAGTLLVKTMPLTAASAAHPSIGPYPDPPDPGPRNLTPVGKRLFFTSYYGGLWLSDGTPAGTRQLSSQLGLPGEIVNINGTVFFNTATSLWRSDGTPAGTYDVFNLPGTPSKLFNADGTLFFRILTNPQRSAELPPGRSFQLWRSDGTSAGTSQLKAFTSPFYAASVPNPYMPDPTPIFACVQGRVFFAADDGVHGMELWSSDGTPAGTVMSRDIATNYDSNPYDMTVGAGGVFFGANGDAGGIELWHSNGTTSGTAQVRDITTTPGSAAIDQQIDVQGRLFFTANTGHGQSELWKSDGTPEGTSLIKLFDILPGQSGGLIYWPLQLRDALGSTLLFDVQNPHGYQELWRSNGTPAGTVPLPELSYNSATHPVLLNGQWFFAGCGLVRSDSSLSSIVKITDRCLNQLLAFNSQLVFSTSDGPVPGVWKSDGTLAGTVALTQFPSEPGSQVIDLVSAGNRLFFRYQRANGNSELWTSDGTAGGTSLVTALPPNSEYLQFIGVDNRLLFGVRGKDALWPDLWVSDGTAAGTLKVKDQLIGPHPSLPTLNGVVLFPAATSNNIELWKSDGTLAGTQKVATITTDFFDLYWLAPHAFSVAHNTLFFLAGSNIGKAQIWRSDGTTAGTHVLEGVDTSYLSLYSNIGATLSGSHLFVPGARSELRAVPVSDGVDQYVAVPEIAFAPPQGQGFIPIVYANRGAQIASQVTLSVTLSDGLSYAGDDSSVTPTQIGNTLTWHLPDAGFLDTRVVHVRVTTPDAPLGTRYPVVVALSSAEADADPANNSASVEVQLARQIFVPLIGR